ncbi:MAG: hypothetical protein ABH827_07090 [bacterium]
MIKNIRDLIENWPRCFIRDVDLVMLFKNKTNNARYSLVKRAVQEGLLTRVRRGLYLIMRKTEPLFIEQFELASLIYGPSFTSLESALSYYGWIPEGVYTTTCVSIKRAKEFKTSFGVFSYKRVPEEQFYTGVTRIENTRIENTRIGTKNTVFFVATPWRAIADLIYIRRKYWKHECSTRECSTRECWKSLEELGGDLRIDRETFLNSDKEMLKLLAESYPSYHVCKILKRFLKEITNVLKVYK